MKYILFAFLILTSVFSEEDGFISEYEYAKMLYSNPRGIGCVKCHGEKGKGDVIARYVHKGTPRTLIAPRLNKLTFKAFKKGFKKPHKVMPKYFLTDKEIESLYFYITTNEDEY